jgi:hypothetical protein
LDDSKYAPSIAEQLDEESKDALSDDDMSKLLYTLSVGMTSQCQYCKTKARST